MSEIKAQHGLSPRSKLGTASLPAVAEVESQGKTSLLQQGDTQECHDMGVLLDKALESSDPREALEVLQAARQNTRPEFVNQDGVWKLGPHTNVLQMVDEQTQLISKLRHSAHSHALSLALRSHDEALCIIAQAVETILHVQHQWSNLNTIFTSKHHSGQELEKERVNQEEATAKLQRCMASFQAATGIEQACQVPGLLEDLSDLDARIRSIEAGLFQFLEVKRRVFPRFHYISSEAMFEILGGIEGNPHAIQRNLVRLFAGVHRLDVKPAPDGQQAVCGLFSKDGEHLPFASPVPIQGSVECWMAGVDATMRSTVQMRLQQVIEEQGTIKLETWVTDNQAQFVMVAAGVRWTRQVEQALAHPSNPANGLSILHTTLTSSYVRPLRTMAASHLSGMLRKKVEALMITALHDLHVIERLRSCSDGAARALEWRLQLRYYHDDATNQITVKQGIATFEYGSEYLGDCQRLVLTPAIERHVQALTTATFMHAVACTSGAVSTGKTGIIKELGVALGRHVFILNCNEGMNHKRTGKVQMGACQTGAWLLYDNVNCLQADVMSAFAAQIGPILQALKNKESFAEAQGERVPLSSQMAVFGTMNPSFPVMKSLPDNMQQLMWPIAMIAPDIALVSEVVLRYTGFHECQGLSRKLSAFRQLVVSSLPQRPHYLFGLRSFIFPAIYSAGRFLREHPDLSEGRALARAIVESCQHRMVAEDLPLFQALLNETFVEAAEEIQRSSVLAAEHTRISSIEFTQNSKAAFKAEAIKLLQLSEKVKNAIEEELEIRSLEIVPALVTKIEHLLEIMFANRCNMLVGESGTGKTTAWQCARAVVSRLHLAEPDNPAYRKVVEHTIYPTSLAFEELYGSFDNNMQWTDGILPAILRHGNGDELQQRHWVVFDGPLEPFWPKLLSTLFDDSRMLLLPSGHMLTIKDEISLFIETDDLSHASPATISRTYLTYFNHQDLGWQPLLQTWLAGVTDQSLLDWLDSHAHRQIGLAIASLEASKKAGYPSLPVGRLTCIQNLLHLLESTAPKEPSTQGAYQMWFSFALIWAIGSVLSDTRGRQMFDQTMRQMDHGLPPRKSTFDYLADMKSSTWVEWAAVVPPYREGADMHNAPVMVPTASTTSSSHIALAYLQHGINTLVMGPVGSGKSILAGHVLERLPTGYATCSLNCTAFSSSKEVQGFIERHLETRSKGVLGPPSGSKRLVAFVDDINVPHATPSGTLPPVDFLTGLVDTNRWYDRKTAEMKKVVSISLLAAMTPRTGQHAVGSLRIMAKCAVVFKSLPDELGYATIFKALLPSSLAANATLRNNLIAATLSIYKDAKVQLPVVPRSDPYYFGVGNLAGIASGLRRLTVAQLSSQDEALRLWCHEVNRVLGSQCLTEDEFKLQDIINGQLQHLFATSWLQLFGQEHGCPPYAALGPKAVFDAVSPMQVEDLLNSPESIEGGLVNASVPKGILFREDVDHICKLNYLLEQQHKHLVLLNKFGSSSRNIAIMAGIVARCHVHVIDPHLNTEEYKEILLTAFYKAAAEGEKAMLLYDDSQPARLNDASNIITTGHVPAWIPLADKNALLKRLMPHCHQAGMASSLHDQLVFLNNMVHAHIHAVVCAGGAGNGLENFFQRFPGCLKYTIVNAVNRYRPETLSELVNRELKDQCLHYEGVRHYIAKAAALIHRAAVMHANTWTSISPLPVSLSTYNVRGIAHTFRQVLKYRFSVLEARRAKLQQAVSKLQNAKDQAESIAAAHQAAQAAKGTPKKLPVKEVQAKKAAHDKAQAALLNFTGALDYWQAQLYDLDEHIKALPGDALLASAFLAYAGFFESKLRTPLRDIWRHQVTKMGLKVSPDYSFYKLLVDQDQILRWRQNGLSADTQSLNSAALAAYGPSWPLVIDQQGHAQAWLEKIYKGTTLHTVDLHSKDAISQLQQHATAGEIVLLKGLKAHVDPELQALIRKETTTEGENVMVSIDNTAVKLHKGFRLIILTNAGSHHLPDSINGRVSVLNHIQSAAEMETEISEVIMEQEAPDRWHKCNALLEQMRQRLEHQEQKEAEAMELVAQTSLLEEPVLLTELKKYDKEVKDNQLLFDNLEKSLHELERLTAGQAGAAERSLLLFETCIELGHLPSNAHSQIDHVDLLHHSLQQAHDPKSAHGQGDIFEQLSSRHTLSVLQKSSRGIHLHDRLVMALHVAMVIEAQRGQLPRDQWSALAAHAGSSLPTLTSASPDWLPHDTWVHLHEFMAISSCQEVALALIVHSAMWHDWWRLADAEKFPLPHGTSVNLTAFQELLFIRCLRPSRFKQAVKVFINRTMGAQFALTAESTSNVSQIAADSTAELPCLILHAPNSMAPLTLHMDGLASHSEGARVLRIPLGRGQEPAAEALVSRAEGTGQWAHITNVHLAGTWLPKLISMVKHIGQSNPNQEFRLWLSVASGQPLPSSLMHSCLVVALERPQGIKANMQLLLSAVMRKKPFTGYFKDVYPKIFYAAAFLHSVLVMHSQLETTIYQYRLSDFMALDDAIRLCLAEQQDEVPWADVQLMVTCMVHGSRMSDASHRRQLEMMVHNIVSKNIVSEDKAALAPIPQYFVPSETSLAGLQQHIEALPDLDLLEAYWQHVNSVLPHEKRDSQKLIADVQILQRVHFADLLQGTPVTRSPLEVARAVSRQTLRQMEELRKLHGNPPDASKALLASIFWQEAILEQVILDLVRECCYDVLAPNAHMTAELASIVNALAADKVPDLWAKGRSLTGVQAWASSFITHMVRLYDWINGKKPDAISLSEFKRPGALLTAVLQGAADEHNELVGNMCFQALQIDAQPGDIPHDGIYIKRLHLDGAAWDSKAQCLCDPLPSQPSMPMPIMHLKPAVIEAGSKSYCPMYQREAADGNGQRTSLAHIHLAAGANNTNNRLIHGTALFLTAP